LTVTEKNTVNKYYTTVVFTVLLVGSTTIEGLFVRIMKSGGPLQRQVEAGYFLEKVGRSKKIPTALLRRIVVSNSQKYWESVGMKCVMRAINASKCVCGRVSAPDRAGGAYSAPPDPIAA